MRTRSVSEIPRYRRLGVRLTRRNSLVRDTDCTSSDTVNTPVICAGMTSTLASQCCSVLARDDFVRYFESSSRASSLEQEPHSDAGALIASDGKDLSLWRPWHLS